MLFVVISYDIRNNRRRTRVSRRLEDFGAQRVQYSVFECYVTAENLDKLRRRLEKEFDPTEDSIRFYTLCANCRGRVTYMGVAEPVPEPGLRII